LANFYASPIGNDAPFFIIGGSGGVPASGAKLFLYQSGSTTKITSYTDSTGATPNSNPVLIGSTGYPQSGGNVVEIFFALGQTVKYVLAPSTDSDPPSSPYWTRDFGAGPAGINDPSATTATGTEWIAFSGTPTFVGTTSFTLTGDQRGLFQVDRRVKSTNSGGTIYSSITVSSFGAGVTTVTVVNDTGVLDSGLSAVSYGLLSATNRSIPPINTLADQTDPSKKVTIGASGITTGTTRTLTSPDSSGTLLTTGNASQFNVANATLVPSVAASALTIALKTVAGNDPSAGDPVLVDYRNATVATGDQTVLSVVAATSLVVPSGATLGTSNNVAFKFWIVGFNDGGTFRLGAVNVLSGTNIYPLGQFPIASATSISAASGSAQVIYSNAAVTSKAYVVIGYLSYESGLAAVGTYGVPPIRVQLYSPSFPLPGGLIQRQGNYTGAVSSGTTTIPFDDTIPQSTEGDQYMTQAITPTSAANVLRISAKALLINTNVGGTDAIIALFQDATASALSVGHMASSVGPLTTFINHEILSGLTTSTTFKIRGGSDLAGTTTFNGVAATRKYGGVLNSYLIVDEVMA